MALVIDRVLGEKILSIVDAGLSAGEGIPEPGKMCVEAAICYALGEPHGDNPSCTAGPDRQFKIKLNDCAWSSNATRAEGMRLLSIAQLGTRGLDRKPWVDVIVRETIRRIVPIGLRAAAKRVPAHAASLEEAAVRCARDADRAAAIHARDVARGAAAAAADYAADAAAAAADYAAAAAAAYAAAAAADYAADYAAARDSVLRELAACALTAYRETGSPGYDLLIEMGLAAARSQGDAT